MKAILQNKSLERRYCGRFELFRFLKGMLFTLTFIWIVNIIILVTSPTISTKYTPCFTDGDCPSALEKCVYGSWKGLGNCRRQLKESTGDLRRIVRSNNRHIFKNRRLVRRKRNPSSIWNDSYLSQRRWDVWLPTRKQNRNDNEHFNTVRQSSDITERFNDIVADVINFGRSYITFKGINYTVAAVPASGDNYDWFITLSRDKSKEIKIQANHIDQGHLTENNDQVLQNHEQALPDARTQTASILLENSFQSIGNNGDAIVNISVRYPIRTLSSRTQGKSSDIRLRIRRQLPGRLIDLNSIDPLINRNTHVEPVIPAAEDIFGKNIGKRSTRSNKEMQRIRREMEEIEDDVAPLPKIVRGPDEGPIIIEDLFSDSVRSSSLRRRRHHKTDIMRGLKNRKVVRHKRHYKKNEKDRSIVHAGSTSLLGGSQKRNKRKLSHELELTAPVTNEAAKQKAIYPREIVEEGMKKQTFKTKTTERDQQIGGKTVRKVATGTHSKDSKRNDGGSSGGNSTNPGTTEAPDPFASLRNTKEPHIDYYDVSKRDPLKAEEDIDPESSLDGDDSEDSDTSPDDDDSEIDSVQEKETRKKRQTLAEELEDDDDEQDIPSWRETAELLRRAGTFAVPVHDSSGHIILVRRVRDLGALDLGESLAKLKETMAKIFGRCSPTRRRKRSHREQPEVVTDQLSNEETWEIQGQDHEMVDQAKINVHMDDDKPYNVTTVMRPMGKRSYNSDHMRNKGGYLEHTKMGLRSETTREMRDILDQNAKLDTIPYLKRIQKNPNGRGTKKIGKRKKISKRLAHLKRDEENIPVNKDVHMEVQEGSPVEIDLTLDEQPGAAHPTVEVQSSPPSTSQTDITVSKRNQHRRSKLASSRSSRTGQSLPHMKSRMSSPSHRGSLWRRKSVREPYIITRRYNDSKTRQGRGEGGGRRTRELADTGSIDRAKLLYLADGDSSWRVPLGNVKRNIDIEVDIKPEQNKTSNSTSKPKSTTTTTRPPSTAKAVMEKEKDEDVFSGNSNSSNDKKKSSIGVSASLTSDRQAPSRSGTASVVVGSQSSPDFPIRANVIRVSPPRPKSVLTVERSEGTPIIDGTITSSDLDWGISSSSDRLMALISGIEKALRVPLGGSDSLPDQITLVDDSSNAVQTQIIRSQPEITEQKTRYLYSDSEPQSPVVISTTTQEKKPDVVKMDIATGTDTVATNIGDLSENIYLKGFDIARKPAKPLFVDSAAKKMIWMEPSYKTVVASGLPKYRQPLGFVQFYNGGLARVKPVDKWTQVTNIQKSGGDTIEDVTVDNTKQVTVEKLAVQPPNTAITGIRTSKTTEFLEPPRVLEVEKNVFLNGMQKGPPPPEKDRDTLVKVVSSVSSEDPESRKSFSLNGSPTVEVHMDGQEQGPSMKDRGSSSNIRILRNERNAEGGIAATLGSQSNNKKKKDLQEIGDASGIPFKHSRLLSSDGIVLSENRLSSVPKGAPSLQRQGDKRNAQHIYRAPSTRNSHLFRRRINSSKGAKMVQRHAGETRAQPSPVVHTYSKDPGVQGATVEMMNDLASRLASQRAQRRKAQALTRVRAACANGMRNCRHKRHARQKSAVSDNIPNFDMSPIFSTKPSRSSAVSTRKVMKRDVSRTVFEQPKVFVVSPSTVFEAPGTKYKFIDPMERGSAAKHLKIYTVSNISDNDGSLAPIQKSSVEDNSLDGSKETSVHDNAESLPMSHEKALQETEGHERFKILDSVEGFSAEVPSFAKKVTGGGQISEDRMVPTTLEVERMEMPNKENRVALTADVESQASKPGFKVSATETIDSGNVPMSNQKTQTIEYTEVAENTSDSYEHVTEVIQVIDRSALSTRKKRRSPSTGTNNRKSREEKIQSLRNELQNLNDIGTKLGLHFFDASSIDRIVREVTHEGEKEISETEKRKHERSKNAASNKKRRRINPLLALHTKMENRDFDHARSENKRNARRRIAKHVKGVNMKHSSTDGTIPRKVFARRSNGESPTQEKRKRHSNKSATGQDQEKKGFKGGHRHFSPKREMIHHRKPPRDVNSKDAVDIEVAPTYHYKNEIENNHPIVISNPENHDMSNNRQREETLTVSNRESEPLEVKAVLRGRRKKREIKPGEFFRFSREGPVYKRSDVRQAVSPSYPAMTGQWQKQFGPVRLNGDEAKQKFREPASLLQNNVFGESSERASGLTNAISPERRSFPRRQIQQKPENDYPQRQPNTEMVKRQQIINAFPVQRNFGSQGRQSSKDSNVIDKSSGDRGIASGGLEGMITNDMTNKPSKQETLKPERHTPKTITRKTSNATKQEPAAAPRKPKGPEMGVWRKLGEIFDIGPKETPRPEPDVETTASPTSSPPPLPVLVVSSEEVARAPPVLDGRPDEREGPRRLSEPSPPPRPEEDRVKSGLRAAIVDRLLQDLRKMASARGSEMVRAESDLIEILHDYQTDLMDEDEEAVAGEPFQGVRIHDNVAIPVVYPAVPIKTESLSQHRLAVRSSDQRSTRDRSSTWDAAAYNPP